MYEQYAAGVEGDGSSQRISENLNNSLFGQFSNNDSRREEYDKVKHRFTSVEVKSLDRSLMDRAPIPNDDGLVNFDDQAKSILPHLHLPTEPDRFTSRTEA